MNVSNFRSQENKLVSKFIYYVVEMIPINYDFQTQYNVVFV